MFEFFQYEYFFLFLSTKNLPFRWFDQKKEENVEKEKKSSESKKKIISRGNEKR